MFLNDLMRFNESPPIPDTLTDQEVLLFSVLNEVTTEGEEHEYPIIAVGYSTRRLDDEYAEWTGEVREIEDGFEIVEYRVGDEQPMFTTRIAREEDGTDAHWTTTLYLHRWARFSPEPLENDLSPFMYKLKEYFG